MFICHEQALKSGQIPVEFQIPNNDVHMAADHVKDDKMDMDDQNEVSDVQDQKQTEDPTPVEQVTSYVYTAWILILSLDVMNCY